MDWDVSITSLSTALGIGLLVGTVRERHQAADRIGKAGLRTHALLTLTGALAAGFGSGALLVALAAVGALAVAGYRGGGAAHDPGLTGEVAMLVSVLLGAVAQQSPALAAGLGVLVAVLLWAKAPLRRLSQELISEREVQDGLLLAASALVILPLLPDRAVDPWGVVQLSTLWKIVVLIMATGMLGHVARRAVGARRGLPVAGFFSGFASSTAAVVSFGHLSRAQPALAPTSASAALLANLASVLLLVAVVAAVSPTLVPAIAWPIAGACAGLLLVAANGLLRGNVDGLPAGPEPRAFRISHALAIALVIAGVMLASEALHRAFGDAGAMTGAIVAALAELHAAAATVARLAENGSLDPVQAGWGMVGLLAATSIAKSLIAFVSGGGAYGRRVAAGLVLMTAAAAAGAWFTTR
ncbi:MAG TPA: DUF4010 domain-containing protein [Thermomonas sp.]|nr:DUF4010 domain-containing protein [Thermomonas sp.]